MGLMRKLRARWREVWNMRQTRLAVIIVGTVIGTGAYYYPIFQTLFFPPDTMPPEQKRLYEEELYPIKVRKQREAEARAKRQAALEAMNKESS